MPTYDYICDECGHEFEIFESIKADPQTICPECKKETLRRKLGPGAAVIFKGSGFYQTDYRSESYKKAAKADKAASESASKPADSSSKSSSGDTAKPSTTPASTPSTGSTSASTAKPSSGGSTSTS